MPILKRTLCFSNNIYLYCIYKYFFYLNVYIKYKDTNSPLLEIEKRASFIYSLIVNDNNLNKKEFTKPIVKK